MSKSLVLEKSIKFALRIVKLYRFLTYEKHEYVLSKQVLISKTFIAKHVREATQAESRHVFSSEMYTAMKRANETEFWLLILHEGEFLDEKEYSSINDDCVELIKLTTAIAKTTRENG
ncbi:MAG: four helix bundle protein [Acidobacteria bacterium]|nr:four helix bundle protein [Acidobacteriota bacterium]